MAQNPVYNTFRYALSDPSGNFLGRSVDFYADTIVTDLMKNPKLAHRESKL